MKKTFHFQGFTSPNYTQVPDDLFDVLLPQLVGAELKTLLYIIRRTFGFKKSSDPSSCGVSGLAKERSWTVVVGSGTGRP